ncbi:MAG: hypothetical protein ACNS62_24850 [Candidatus Cyclobacteriaceae bacterium M3_2C_046]
MKINFRTGILLIMLLAVPVFLYIFLQLYGSNNYEIPVYYSSGISDSLVNCPDDSGQHRIASLNFIATSGQELNTKNLLSNRITVFSFLPGDCGQPCQVKFNQLSRVLSAFDQPDPVQVVSFVPHDIDSTAFDQLQALYDPGDWYFGQANLTDLQQFAYCDLVLPLDKITEVYFMDTFVLVDQQHRIRGYYEGTNREDIDRLILEIRILLYQENINT